MASKPCRPACTCGKHTAGPKIAAALRGKTLPPDHRAAISRGMTGYVPTATHRARLADSKRGERNPMKRPEVAAAAQRRDVHPVGEPTTDKERRAHAFGIRVPSDATLKRYGLDREDWLTLLAGQGWKCAVCEKRSGVIWNTDHEHVPRWKHMPPEERRRFVRGVLCSRCNWRRVHSRMSALEARRIADYLAAYEARRSA